MKIPYSYRQHFFSGILSASVIGHVVVLGAASILNPVPQYAVEHGPSSMEVVLIKEPIKQEKKEKIEKLFLAERNLIQEPVKKEKSEEKRIDKSVYIPPAKGALNEPKPNYLKNPAPTYPELARERGWEGTVVLRVLVGENGSVKRIRVHKSSGYDILDQSALKTVQKWQFLPARMKTVTFTSWIKIPIRFLLTEES